jgi:hypothetical protein
MRLIHSYAPRRSRKSKVETLKCGIEKLLQRLPSVRFPLSAFQHFPSSVVSSHRPPSTVPCSRFRPLPSVISGPWSVVSGPLSVVKPLNFTRDICQWGTRTDSVHPSLTAKPGSADVSAKAIVRSDGRPQRPHSRVNPCPLFSGPRSVLKQDEPNLAASCEGLRRPGQKAQVVRLSTPAKTVLIHAWRGTPTRSASRSISARNALGKSTLTR